jgi:iron complex outermembrane recepter protein
VQAASRNHHLATVCVVLASAGSPQVWAQDASAEASSDGNVLEEVLVTAERRTQSLQKSSVSIQAYSSEALQEAGVSQIRDLTAISPGVQIGQGGAATQIYIRGVGDFGALPTSNAAVSTYVDGFYVARSNAIEGNFFDIARLEILKGPQGTLYGRNSAAGALNIITNQPILGKNEGAINAEVGNYDLTNVDGMLNLALGDSFALRGALQVVRRDGYASDGTDDDKKESFRLQALYQPGDDFSLKLAAAYTNVTGKGSGYMLDTLNFPAAARADLAALGVTIPNGAHIGMTDPRAGNVVFGIGRLLWGEGFGPFALNSGQTGPYSGLFALPYCYPKSATDSASVSGVNMPIAPTTAGLCNVNTGAPAGTFVAGIDPTRWASLVGQDNRYWNINAELNVPLGFAKLTVMPGYRRVDNDYTVFHVTGYDNGGRKDEVSESSTIEVRLANDSDLIDWTAGLYYFDERQSAATGAEQFQMLGGFLGNNAAPVRIETNNYAAFAQATWKLSENLRLITGGRYSHEKKEIDGSRIDVYPNFTFTLLPVAPGVSVPLGCYSGPVDCLVNRFVGAKTDSAFNWKAGVEYDLTPQNMLYATVATGFKAGGLNYTAVDFPNDLTPIPYDPEKLTALTIGSRNRFMDGRLQVNAEGFYWNYEDHQDNVAVATGSGALVGVTQNAGKAKSYGAELDVVAKVTGSDTLRLNMQLNETRYDRFSFLSSPVSQFDTGCATGPSAVPGSVVVDCSGFPLTNAPKVTGSAAFTHVFVLPQHATLDATISGQYASSRYLYSDFTQQMKAPSYGLVNVNATYHSPDDNWSFGVFGRNLTDEDVYTGGFAISGFYESLKVVNVGAPRTYGAHFSVKF